MRSRRARLNLSPWVRAVAGDTSGLDVPYGYLVTGIACSGAGPWRLELIRHGDGVIASKACYREDDVRPALESLTDIAAIDAHERASKRVSVTRVTA